MGSMMMFRAPALLGALTIAAGAQAQSMNIDFGTATPIPSSSYGAAAGSVGVWNVYGGGAASGLLDLSGNPTGVSISGTGGFASDFMDPLTTGDDDALLDDFLAIPFFETYTVSGIAAGTYDVYVTTWTFGPLSSGIEVNGLGMQVIGGVWTGGFTQGVTHSLHTVTLASTQNLVIDVSSIDGALGTISGVQIVLVPGPGAGALLACAALAGIRTRRR
jgi:hypothetical protein